MNLKKSLWNIGFFNGFIKMFIYATNFFWAVYYNALGFSGAEIGLITAIFSLTGFVSIIPSGFINDKVKSKNLITLALLFLAIQCFGVSQFHTFPAIMLFAAIGGLGYNLYTTSMDSLFYKSMEKDKATRHIAIFQGINYLFIGAGAILGGRILNTSENMTEIFKTLITITGSGYAIFTIISLILPNSVTTKFEFIKYKSDIFNPKVLFFILIIFLFSFHYGAENTSYGLFVSKTLGLSKEASGLYMGFAILSMGITSVLFSNSLKKLNAKTVLYAGLLSSGVGHIFMAMTSNVYMSFAFRVLHETGDAAMFVFLAFGIAHIFNKERVGGNASIFAFIQIVGGAVSSMLFGPIGAKYGYNIPLIATGVVLLCSLLTVIMFNKMVFQKES